MLSILNKIHTEVGDMKNEISNMNNELQIKNYWLVIYNLALLKYKSIQEIKNILIKENCNIKLIKICKKEFENFYIDYLGKLIKSDNNNNLQPLNSLQEIITELKKFN